MELERHRRRRRRLHILNLLMVLGVILLSAGGLVLADREGADWTASLFAWLSLGIGCMGVILGALLPEKERGLYVSEGTRSGLAFLSLLLNHRGVAPSVLRGGSLYRAWNSTVFLILAILMAPLIGFGGAVCGAQGAELAKLACWAAAVLWLLLPLTCGLWTYDDGCITRIEESGQTEGQGRAVLKNMAMQAAIVFAIFGIGALGAYVQDRLDKDRIPTVDTRRLQEEAQAAMEALEQLEPEDFFAQEEFSSIGEALACIKLSHGDQRMYYSLQYPQADSLNIISWNESGEEVYVDCFAVLEGDRLKREKFFVSSALTRADVEGQESGFIE